jgi:hypothetical protein
LHSNHLLKVAGIDSTCSNPYLSSHELVGTVVFGCLL